MPLIFDGRFAGGADFADYALLEINGENIASSALPGGMPGVLDLVNDPAGSGFPVSRHTLNISISPEVKRCEINSPTDPIGSQRWYYNAIYLPADWAVDPIGVNEIIAQIHDLPDAGDPEREPPFSIRVERNKLLVIRTAEGPGNTAPVTTEWGGPLIRGRWVDWVYYIDWQHTQTGTLRAWQDGRKIVDRTAVATCFNDARPLYAKLGPYKYVTPNNPLRRRVTYNRGTVIGSGYASYNDFADALGISHERETVLGATGSMDIDVL